MTVLTDDDAFVIALALDDWLEQNRPTNDPKSQARYDHTRWVRDRLDAEAPDKAGAINAFLMDNDTGDTYG